jgi:putative restriction endonuclease
MEDRIRIEAFKWLEKQTMYDDIIARDVLSKGFYYGSNRITLVGPQGIWKPRLFSVPLSITTSPNSPYNDSISKDGFLKYKYRGTDPNHRDNVGLRKAMLNRIPLIYFHGIVPGKYLAAWPVYIIRDDPANLSFTVAVDDKQVLGSNIDLDNHISEESVYYRRRYISSTVKTRLHQYSFRERVLDAYKRQCAFCRLRHAELLDAAHIVPDSEESGDPIVNNGLALCKIHHAAFDRQFIGVSPDYKIIVREDILYENDGPMLKHGIQELHNKTLLLPSNSRNWPDQERLEERFILFKNVAI